MCGIAGIFNPERPPSIELLAAMAVPLVKRGPDDGGTAVHDAVGLVHRRLSVIDLAGGRKICRQKYMFQ